MTAKERNDQTNSGSEEELSEEFKNFDNGMERILSLTPKQAKRVRDKVPAPKKRRKTPRK